MIRYSHNLIRLCLCAALITLLGCKPGRVFSPFQHTSIASSDPVLDPMFEGNRPFMPLLEPAEPIINVKADEVAPALADTAEARPAKNILALSGGGSYGAFTAGVLNGWTVGKYRPEFDVVTGVSTGGQSPQWHFLANLTMTSYAKVTPRFHVGMSSRIATGPRCRS